jgi:uncharacterized protein
MTRITVPQHLRYTFLIVELVALLGANKIAFGDFLPGTDPSGLWFYAALFGLLLGQRLDTPFFTAPKDAVLYALPALIAILQIADAMWRLGGWAQSAGTLLAGWIVLVLVAASLAVWFNGSRQPSLARLGSVCVQLSAGLGNPKSFFSVILFLILAAFPPATVQGLLAIFAAWAITVPFSLLDFVYDLLRKIRWHAANRGLGEHPPEVVFFQQPGHVLIRGSRDDALPIGSTVAYRDRASDVCLAFVLSKAGRDTGILMRALDLGRTEQQFPGLALVEPMQVILVVEDQVDGALRERIATTRAKCIGFVAPNTEIHKLLFEVTAERDLVAGRLVAVSSGQRELFYQMTNGLTREEIVQQKSTYGFITAEARPVGVWIQQDARFEPILWVPAPNAPVELVEAAVAQFERSRIGVFPGTSFAIRLNNMNQLVTHNTAILGILGVGKSTLAMELVERVLETGCKAIILDLTDQYASELGDLLDDQFNNATIETLKGVGAAGRDNVQLNVEEGGSRNQFAEAVTERLEAFMVSQHRLLILNPSEFEVWRQDSRPFQGRASMASLTACELTHIVSDAALGVVQRRGRTDDARLCLVYEEAHSLVPEWNATVAEGDRAAANGTARAILQGRKYGLGCFLVTQRTASVTKTILNQCNTVFAMRSFDDTGKEFLANYIGRDYASLLPNLPERHAVFYGRASSCENPVHIQLNDRAVFINGFRAPGE